MNKLPFIGYYGYWVILTYLSIISAIVGIYFVFGENIRYAIICMMISGVCDTFDGRVAKLKKRDSVQFNFGVQIDAMADLISFGVLPAVILYSLGQSDSVYGVLHIIIPVIYVLTAFIRLAYFTATEVEQINKNEKRTYFEGLPTTSVALIIPIIYSICNVMQASFFTALNIAMAVISVLFVLKIRIRKPKTRTQVILCVTGFLILVIMYIVGGSINGY